MSMNVHLSLPDMVLVYISCLGININNSVFCKQPESNGRNSPRNRVVSKDCYDKVSFELRQNEVRRWPHEEQ